MMIRTKAKFVYYPILTEGSLSFVEARGCAIFGVLPDILLSGRCDMIGFTSLQPKFYVGGAGSAG